MKVSLLILAVLLVATLAYRPVEQAEPHYLKRLVYKMPLNSGPNARELSNLLGAINYDSPKSASSMWKVLFAQLITHDLSSQRSNSTRFDVPLPLTDRFYNATGTSNFIAVSGTLGDYLPSDDGDNDEDVVDLHVKSDSTDSLDMSFIYGSNANVSNILRSFVGGRLLTSDYDGLIRVSRTVFLNITRYYNLPPSQARTGLEVAPGLTANSEASRFTAGDRRINENIGGVVINVVFYRNANYHADRLAALNPSQSDDYLFNEQRKWNIAEYQNIVFYEFLPGLLGSLAGSVKPYRGYDPEADERTSVEFALQAFRYAHSQVSRYLIRQADGSQWNFSVPGLSPPPYMPLAGQMGGPLLAPVVFVLADNYTASPPKFDGMRNLARGLVTAPADDSDIYYSDDVRNAQFQGGVGAAFDLFTIDVQRARLSDAPSYYDLYKFGNIRGIVKRPNFIYQYSDCDANKNSPAPDPLACFSRITSNVTLATLLQQVYGKVTAIDGIVGLLAEDRYPGSTLSRTAAGIIIQEFERKRDADAYWFERVLSDDELRQVYGVKMSTLIKRNLDMTDIQDEAFVVPQAYLA